MIRFFDIILSTFGMVLLFPVYIVVIIAICLDSKGGPFYTQIRVGRNGCEFKLFKFRSMSNGSDKTRLITVGEKDSRITKVGYFLRKYKIDELPQLMNVLLGDMSIVGPRPEVRKYVDLYNDKQKTVLSVKPGISDYASIEYIDENIILGKAKDPDKVYIEEILPKKIKYNMIYIENKSLKEYLKIIFLTICKIAR